MPLENSFTEVDYLNSNSSTSDLSLHQAALSLFSDLSLEGVLRRVLHASRELVSATSAGLHVHDELADRDRYFSDGLSRDEVEEALAAGEFKVLPWCAVMALGLRWLDSNPNPYFDKNPPLC